MRCNCGWKKGVFMMTMRERIATGRLYTDMTEGLPEERMRGKELMYDFNHTRPSEEAKRAELMEKMFKSLGKDCWIEPPIFFAYGNNVSIGDNFYANFNLTLVDDGLIEIGNRVLLAPNVVLSTSGHPLDPELRGTGQQYSFPIVLKDDVWLGSGVIVNPGITIGKGSVIGAGSVVTADIPPGVVAVGSPCKVLREIGPQDKIYYFKDHKVDD